MTPSVLGWGEVSSRLGMACGFVGPLRARALRRLAEGLRAQEVPVAGEV